MRSRRAVSSAPCLAIPDPQREFIVHTDASGYATGAVLMQQFDEGLRPIAFLSKKMSPRSATTPCTSRSCWPSSTRSRRGATTWAGDPFTVLHGPPVAAVRGDVSHGDAEAGALGGVAGGVRFQGAIRAGTRKRGGRRAVQRRAQAGRQRRRRAGRRRRRRQEPS